MSKQFCPFSLGDWLELCDQLNIPAVPAEKVAEVERNDLLNDEPEIVGPHHARVRKAFEQMGQARRDGHMMRWDCCASEDLKCRVNSGDGRGTWDASYAVLPHPLGDPRAFDIIYEYPRFMLPVWRRPWVPATIHDRYPVEYRVYVLKGELQGVSNYYSQRPLPYNMEHIMRVTEYTQRFAEQLQHSRFEWEVGHHPMFIPGTKGFLDHRGVAFSADFMVDQHDNVLFLEGGPPHELDKGAHPCCFRAGEISGTALSDRNKEDGNE